MKSFPLTKSIFCKIQIPLPTAIYLLAYVFILHPKNMEIECLKILSGTQIFVIFFHHKRNTFIHSTRIPFKLL